MIGGPSDFFHWLRDPLPKKRLRKVILCEPGGRQDGLLQAGGGKVDGKKEERETIFSILYCSMHYTSTKE